MHEPVNELGRLIARQIETRGAMTFARFMALALYTPRLGYYAGGGTDREPIGWSGDFFTSGDVHPLWGECLARQFAEMWQRLGQPERFDLLELGAGRGLLARDIWRYSLARLPDFAAALRYTLADRAPGESALHTARRNTLHAALEAVGAPPDRTRWGDDAEPLAPGSLVGCIFSNELVDALPVHIVEVHDGALAEVYVTTDPTTGALVKALGEPSTEALATYLDAYDIPWRSFPEGWQGEICLDAPLWLAQVAALVQRGYVLTIDYGAEAQNLYLPERRGGTLAVYSAHQMGDAPLTRPGQQDLTAHVNFTALERAGASAALYTEGLTTQADFLRHLGIHEEADALARRLYPAAETERHTDRGQADLLRRRALEAAVATLLNPHGLGGFRVLAQSRGVPPGALWSLVEHWEHHALKRARDVRDDREG